MVVCWRMVWLGVVWSGVGGFGVRAGRVCVVDQYKGREESFPAASASNCCDSVCGGGNTSQYSTGTDGISNSPVRPSLFICGVFNYQLSAGVISPPLSHRAAVFPPPCPAIHNSQQNKLKPSTMRNGLPIIVFVV